MSVIKHFIEDSIKKKTEIDEFLQMRIRAGRIWRRKHQQKRLWELTLLYTLCAPVSSSEEAEKP